MYCEKLHRPHPLGVTWVPPSQQEPSGRHSSPNVFILLFGPVLAWLVCFHASMCGSHACVCMFASRLCKSMRMFVEVMVQQMCMRKAVAFSVMKLQAQRHQSASLIGSLASVHLRSNAVFWWGKRRPRREPRRCRRRPCWGARVRIARARPKWRRFRIWRHRGAKREWHE